MLLNHSWKAGSSLFSQNVLYNIMKLDCSWPCSQQPPLISMLSPANSFHAPQYASSRSILKLSSRPCLGLHSYLFPSGVTTQILYIFPISHITATYAVHLTFLDLSTFIIYGEQYKFWSTSLWLFLKYSATSSLLGPTVFLSQCSSHSVRDKVSQPPHIINSWKSGE
jgi:hypothetical protein